MSPSNTTATPVHRIKVWDGLVRLLHWVQAPAIALAWLSTVIFGWSKVHEPAGYVALTAAIIRVIWGFFGSHHARFTQFVAPLQTVKDYTIALLHRREGHYLGHNPLGGWMIVALLTTILLTGITGWLFNTDMFWGMYWLALLHETLAWLLLVLIVLHLCGVVFTGIRQRENLTRAMFTGYKLRRESAADQLQ